VFKPTAPSSTVIGLTLVVKAIIKKKNDYSTKTIIRLLFDDLKKKSEITRELALLYAMSCVPQPRCQVSL